jgi:hypothetical protein
VGEANLLKDHAILKALVRGEADETGGLEVMSSWALPNRWSAPRFRIMDWLVGITNAPLHPQRTAE